MTYNVLGGTLSLYTTTRYPCAFPRFDTIGLLECEGYAVA